MVQIRRFENMDALPTSELITGALQKCSIQDTPANAIQQLLTTYTPEGVVDISKKKQLYVAVENSSLVLGTVGIDENTITTLFVHPMHINEGIGTMLLQHAELIVKNQNYSHVKCVSSIGAKRFFQKFGYNLVSDIVLDNETVSYQMQKAF